MKLKQLALAALLAPLALSTYAGGFAITGDAGEDFVDSNRAAKGSEVSDSPLFGGSLGYRYDSGFGVELDYQHAGSIDVKNKASKLKYQSDTQNLSALNGYYAFNQDGVFQPYLLLGVGADDFQYKQILNGTTSKNDATLANAGLGAFLKLNDNFFLRGEVRDAHAFGSQSHDDALAFLGLTYYTGAAKAAPAPEPAPAPAAEPAPVVAPPPPPAAAAAPVDSDGDGVPDSADKCPNTPAGVQVDANGCPLDADNDGVPDYKDKCPNTPAGVQVDGNGCPLDADNDGVPDYLDKCPNTPAGAVVDANGCPKVITEAVKQEVNVLFDTGKAVIKPEYKSEVENVANLAKQYPTAYIEIQGYTDNRGSAKKNIKLSQQRADAIRDSLVHDFGVDPSHVTAKGYGPANPVADNKTAEGRAKNRHVTAVLTAEQKKMEMAPAGAHHHHHKAAAAPAAAQ